MFDHGGGYRTARRLIMGVTTGNRLRPIRQTGSRPQDRYVYTRARGPSVGLDLAPEVGDVGAEDLRVVAAVSDPQTTVSRSRCVISRPRLRASSLRRSNSVGVRWTSSPPSATARKARSTLSSPVWINDCSGSGSIRRTLAWEPRDQFARAERLGYVVIDAGGKRPHLSGRPRKHSADLLKGRLLGGESCVWEREEPSHADGRAGYRTRGHENQGCLHCPREHEGGSLYPRIATHLLIDIHPPDARLSILFAEGWSTRRAAVRRGHRPAIRGGGWASARREGSLRPFKADASSGTIDTG